MGEVMFSVSWLRPMVKAIIAGLDVLPGATLFIIAFIFLTSIFTATTYDSASYVLSASATKSLKLLKIRRGGIVFSGRLRLRFCPLD